MENFLISVIVPVYNVEKYLKRCLKSILNQTYKKIEILIIDDGSTDHSGKISDEYAKIDSRVQVFHKKNGGLSDARNYGIQKAKGKYVMFIDSDDWIPLNSIRKMVETVSQTESDIVSGEIKEVYNTNTEKKGKNNNEYKIEVLSKNEALEKLMYLHNFSNSASAKMYKKELFDNIKFPVGKYYEDLGTTYKIVSKANKISLINSVVYYYYQDNQDSIRHKKYNERRLEGLDFALQELEFIKKEFPDIVPAAIYRLYYECIMILNDMPYKCKEKKYVKQYIKKYKKIVLHDNNLYKKQRLLSYVPLFGQVGIKFAFKIKSQIKKDRTL